MNSETTLDWHAPEGQTRTLHFLTILISKWSPTRTNQPANKPPKPNKRTKLEWLLSLSNTYLPSTGRAVVSIQEFHGAAHHNTMWWFKFSERRMQWRPQEDLPTLYSNEIWVEPSRKIRFVQAVGMESSKGIPSDKEEHRQDSEGWRKRTRSGVSKLVACLTNIIQSEALYQQCTYWPPILGTYWLPISFKVDTQRYRDIDRNVRRYRGML